ncbi:MAG: C40 family peptidase [Armatimonadota bacterium]
MLKYGLIGLIFSGASFAKAEELVLGNYGQTLESTSIYKSASTKAGKFYKAKQYQYLVVKAYNERWTKVLMANNVWGYMLTSKVAILPEEYKVQATRVSDLSSRAKAAWKGTTFKGTPYVWGGNDINRGIDCSAFVKSLYGEIGISLPRTAAEQAKVGLPIRRLEDLRAGDRLYFWEKKRNTIGHTGMYLGNGYFVHSSRGHNGVNTDKLTEKWQRILVAARR